MLLQMLFAGMVNMLLVGGSGPTDAVTNSKVEDTDQPRKSEKYRIPYRGEILYGWNQEDPNKPDLSKYIRIEGAVPVSSLGFIVELCKDKKCVYDVSFRLNVRLDLNKYFCITKLHNDTYMEETVCAEDQPFRFTNGRSFVIVLSLIPPMIKVHVNDKYLFNVSFARKDYMNFISIRGQVQIEWILFSVFNPMKGLTVPNTKHGDKFIFHFTSSTDRFYLDFLCKSAVTFQFEIRYNYAGYKNVVIIGSKITSGWKNNAFSDDFPFGNMNADTMVWTVLPPEIEIYVNEDREYIVESQEKCYNKLDWSGTGKIISIFMT